jgi:hypothetical protein
MVIFLIFTKETSVLSNFSLISFYDCAISNYFLIRNFCITLIIFFYLPLGAHGIRDTLIRLQFLNLRQLVALIGRGINQSQARYLTQTQNERRQRTHDPSIRADEEFSF